MMYRPSSGRRGYEHFSGSKQNTISTFIQIPQILKRKYGLTILNTVLLCALLCSWIWIFMQTVSSTSKISISNRPILEQNSRIHNKHKPNHMKELVEQYQKLKWIDEQKQAHNLVIYNESHYTHKSKNKLFSIWSSQDLKNDESCPDAYPKKPPDFKNMKYVCSHLDWFKFRGYCDYDNCSDCIPPNSKVKGQEWTNSDTKPWLDQYEKTLNDRRHNLTQLLNKHKLFNKNDGPVIVITINHGYSFLFYNWVCSLDYNKISLIRNRTIIVPTHRDTIPLIKKAGFTMIFFPYWLGSKLLGRIVPEMPKTFALGAHRWVVALQIAIISDLIALGFDVITQDSDIIYVKNPLYFVMQKQFKRIDIQMMVDARNDKRGPGNSGYYIVRSNCKTKVFMETMIKLIGAVLVARSDQILWNTLINEKNFRMINFGTFPIDYFVGGNQINIKFGTNSSHLPNNMLLIHACWTTTQFDKIEKFWNVDHYYFTQERCPHLYDYNLMPDLKDKKWHIRAKTLEQEDKLMKLGLVRDTSNGHFTTPKEDK